MATISDSEALDAAAAQRRVKRGWFEPRYIVEVFDGSDDALAALDAIQPGLVSTGFQSLNWISCLYEELAQSKRGTPRLVVVTDSNAGEIVLALPLVIVKRRRLKVAQLADLGVTDYGAPILGPVRLSKPRAIRRVWRAVRHALRDIDLIYFERMPAEIGDYPNPLLQVGGLTPARQSGFRINLETTVDDYIAGRGKKFRKEVQRCHRVWERDGGARFFRAASPDEIARVFLTLDEQQAKRHEELGTRYILDRPAYRAFYERVAMDGSDAGLGYLFAVESQNEIAATLFGIVHGGTFTMLRITFGGDRFAHFSPGRLIIVEAMRHLQAQGITTFDLGMGDYDYKRRMGADSYPLTDLVVARELSAVPRALALRIAGRMRTNRWLRAAFQTGKARFGR